MNKKVIVITGSNGGIGSRLTTELKNKGYRCICVDKDGTDSGDYFVCDFSNISDLTKTADKIKERFPIIDGLFNVAGIGVYKSIEELEISDWISSLSVNLTAPFVMTKILLPSLQNSDSPLVVNFGSGMGVIPSPGRSSYCSSKFGLRGLSLSLAEEFKGKKINFVLLTLGSIMTNFGTGGLEKRKELKKLGKNYLTVNHVVKKVIKIMSSKIKRSEYKIYPSGYESKNQTTNV